MVRDAYSLLYSNRCLNFLRRCHFAQDLLVEPVESGPEP